jgi:hypothetical protein
MPEAIQAQDKARFTPGPWHVGTKDDIEIQSGHKSMVCTLYAQNRSMDGYLDRANAYLIAAAPDLYEAARLQEEAEEFNANCPDCDGDGVPECCEICFPYFDDARLKRRAAIAKAEGQGAE